MHVTIRYQLWRLTSKNKWKAVGFFTEYDDAETQGRHLPQVFDGWDYGHKHYKKAVFKIIRVEEVTKDAV